MAYIGSIPAYQASGVRPRDEFTADGTQICFPLSQSVPGSFESGVTIVLDNVPQQPVEAFTVVDTRTLTLTSISGTFTVNETITGSTSAATGTVLKVNLNNIVIRGLSGTFSSSEGITGGTSAATATTTSVTINEGSGILFSEAPTAASILYVVHEGNATYNLVPTAASVGPSQLADNLRNFTVDTFTGDGTTTTFTLSDTPSSANSLLVMVDGIVQTRTTNYTLSGAVVTFTDAPDSSAAITIIHLGFSTISRTGLVDGSVTTAKIADNAITSAKLGFDVIVAEDIAANAITVAEIANGAVTPAKLSTGGPSWASTGQTTINSTSAASAVILNSTNAGGTALNIQNSGTVNSLLGGYNSIVGSGNATDVMLSATQGALAFGTGASSTERMRIDSSGRLLVGTTSTTTSSSQSGEVYSTGAVGFLLTNTTAANFALSVKNEGTSGTRNLINFYEGTGGGTARANISFDSANSLTFSTAGTARISIPIDAGGIKFPATQTASADANTLDDYEEGTWTPQMWQGSTQITSPNSVAGRYIKIGNVIWIGMYFYKASGAPSSSGQWQVRNLPFSVNASTSGVNAVITGYLGVNGTPSTQTGRFQANSSTALDLYGQYGSTSWTSSYIEFSFSGCLEAG